MNLKTNKISILLIACLAMFSKVHSQTLSMPTGTDILWLSGAGSLINTAVIDLPGDTSANGPTWKQLAACAYNGGVVVKDLVIGTQVNTSYPVSGGPGTGMVSAPDVIIGNNTSSSTPRADFIMAVTFINNATPAQVEVDFFDIHFTSPTAFTVTYNSSDYMTLPTGFTPLQTAHIDVVADHSVTPLYGTLAVCDRFFVVCDAETSAPVYNTFVAYGSLNTYSIFTTTAVNMSMSPSPTTDSWEPDVAGIQRGPVGGFNDIACVTHISQSNKHLYYQEWVAGAAVAGTRKLIGTNIGYFTDEVYAHPRIDANDNYNTNNTGFGCQYRVVCEFTDTTGLQTVYAYPPLPVGPPPVMGGMDVSYWIDLSTMPGSPYSDPLAAPYEHHRPSVAWGSRMVGGSAQYMVTEFTKESIYGDEFFMMSPLSMCGGIDPAPGGSYYFLVNSTYPATSSNYGNSVSTPCNNVGSKSLVAWTHSGNIYYKTNSYGSPTGYVYKQGQETGLQETGLQEAEASTAIAKIYPNPATDLLTINCGTNKADRYRMTNMLGQVVDKGSINAAVQDLSISRLPAGSYIISLYGQDGEVSSHLFHKN